MRACTILLGLATLAFLSNTAVHAGVHAAGGRQCARRHDGRPAAADRGSPGKLTPPKRALYAHEKNTENERADCRVFLHLVSSQGWAG